jgi:hypothetical protein
VVKLLKARRLRPGRTVITGVFAVAVLALFSVAGGLPAQAATASPSSLARFAATATPFQNKAIDAAMASVPGGTRVGMGEVVWHSDRFSLQVPAVAPTGSAPSARSVRSDATPSCASDSFCAWSEKGYTGCKLTAAAGTNDVFDWADWSKYTCDAAGTWSWDNNSSYQVQKWQYYSGGVSLGDYFYFGGTVSGNSWCIGSGDKNQDVTDTQSRTEGWIYLPDAGCVQ